MAGRHPEERVPVPVSLQRWTSLSFLHWRYEPATLQRLLPDGLTADTYDGHAWVGLTPFVMSEVRVPAVAPLGRWSTFPETNLRTYVRGPDGRDGLWFFSLDCANLPVTTALRTAGLPYRWAPLEVTTDDTRISYRGRRPKGPSYDLTVIRGSAMGDAEVDGLVDWLTGRWRAYVRQVGKLWTVPVEHEPWPLQHATLAGATEDLRTAAGLPMTGEPPLVHYSAGVSTRIGVPRPVG